MSRETSNGNTTYDDNDDENSDLFSMEESDHIAPGGIYTPMSDATITECMWYAPLTLCLLYTNTKIEVQLLAAQQG
jgi:hypothetical protein